MVFANAASEEALAAIAAGGSVVLAGCPVPTNGAQGACTQMVGSIHAGTLSWRGV